VSIATVQSVDYDIHAGEKVRSFGPNHMARRSQLVEVPPVEVVFTPGRAGSRGSEQFARCNGGLRRTKSLEGKQSTDYFE